jgi:GDP-D-mannose dehydratase
MAMTGMVLTTQMKTITTVPMIECVRHTFGSCSRFFQSLTSSVVLSECGSYMARNPKA